MKKLILMITLFIITIFNLYASDFKDGMLAYREGNFKKAKEFFESAIKEEKSIQSYFMLGKMYLYGEGVPLNRNKAIEYLKITSKRGNLRAKCYLAEAYLRDNTNKKEAIKLLKIGLKKKVRECKKIARIYNILKD